MRNAATRAMIVERYMYTVAAGLSILPVVVRVVEGGCAECHSSIYDNCMCSARLGLEHSLECRSGSMRACRVIYLKYCPLSGGGNDE